MPTGLNNTESVRSSLSATLNGNRVVILIAEKRTAQGKARLYASAGRDFTCRVDKLWRGNVVESIVFANHVDAREFYDALV